MKVVAALCTAVLFTTQLAIAAVDQQQQFIDMMVVKHKFERAYLEPLFAASSKNESILATIAKPWEARPWYQYYPIFLTDKRLQQGLQFWQKYAAALSRAEQQTGVPAQVIVAILGVETFYGANTGKYSAFEALSTLGFYYAPRQTFFRSELEQLLLLAREEHFNPATITGSYAGALGWGQFIPSSYRAYAVDFDDDGLRDLLNNPVDAIGSIANYFKQHGWQTEQDVTYPVSVSGNKYQPYLGKELTLQHSWPQLQAAGVSLTSAAAPSATGGLQGQVRLMEFAQPDHQEYWLALRNFYVITRYNHSPIYAMVVYQLSEQLKQARAANDLSSAAL